MTEESALLKAVLLQASRNGDVLFRNLVGKAWMGRKMATTPSDALRNITRLAGAHMVTCGLGVGSSDLIGWTPKIVTPEMVGQTIAVFTAVECKSAHGRMSNEQKKFLANVSKAGGIARIARHNGRRVHLTADGDAQES